MNNGLILITGSSGFIGRRIIETLNYNNWKLRALHRNQNFKFLSENVELIGDFNLETGIQNSSILKGVSVIIHCAAKVHFAETKDQSEIEDFRKINTEGTLKIAKQAALNGVKRFIFLSTVKVHGEETSPNIPFYSSSPLRPSGPYAISKAEAEIGLRKISQDTGMEIVIIRPPLVYGENVRANFDKLLQILKYSIPLPFGSITNNMRSFVYIDNLIDLILVCINHPKACGEAFLVSDDHDLSTADLLKFCAKAMGKRVNLFKFSPYLFSSILRMIKLEKLSLKLLQSLVVDITHTKNTLSWQPKFSVIEGLEGTVRRNIYTNDN